MGQSIVDRVWLTVNYCQIAVQLLNQLSYSSKFSWHNNIFVIFVINPLFTKFFFMNINSYFEINDYGVFHMLQLHEGGSEVLNNW